MASPIRISLDVMGGDHGAAVVIAGAKLALERHPDIRFLLFGQELAVAPVLADHPSVAAVSVFQHADVAVRMGDKPSVALRQGRWKSSMWKGIEAVKKGEADAFVSAGNTGAMMVMATFCLRTMAKIDRPALAGLWPNVKGESVVLDVGASIGADAQHLCDLAVMGSAMAGIVFDIAKPTVGLLNIGVEDVKGLEEIRAAGKILRESPPPNLSYHGFVEGDDIGMGSVDVVVTEGFAGNIALKTAEGTAKQIGAYLRAAMGRTLMSRIGYVFARGAFDALREKMDPRRVNGGVLLGVNGIVIKSHGGTDALGFAAAIDLAYDMVRHGLIAKIETAIAAHHLAPSAATPDSPMAAQ